MFSTLDLEGMWAKFCSVLNDAVLMFVPLGKNRKNNNPRWMTRRAMRYRKYKSVMWKRYQLSKSYNDCIEYKHTLNKATKEYKKAKKSLEKKLAKNIKKDTKSFYSYVKSKTKVKESVGPLKNTAGTIVSYNEVMR